jgi:carbonic anhydrase
VPGEWPGCARLGLQKPEYEDGLAAFLGCAVDELDRKCVADPYGAVRVDIDALAANPLIPSTLSVTGLVYDVHTGTVDVVERRAPLRDPQAEGAANAPGS